MKQNIIYIGLDVDDTQYHGSALNKSTGEVLDFKCRPTLKGLMGQIAKLHKVFPGNAFRICYEASYIGFALQRDVADKGVHCDVVAPTRIPNPRGRQIKTDRIDAAGSKRVRLDCPGQPTRALSVRATKKTSGSRGWVCMTVQYMDSSC